ncbi:hypothetical protein ACHQM5_013356 [Ranunculus cassubicifolius]
MAMALSAILALLFLLLSLYCALDPLRHSAISQFPDFKAHPVDLPPWSDLPSLRDTQNLLQKSEIKFLNQIQGPESLVFDNLGRGPYTGVADGRILFWNGESWRDFAYTSPINFMQLLFAAEDTGRVLKYNPVSKETTVLVANSQFPNGLRRYWLKGEKAGTTDVFAILPGYPDNVRTNQNGEFWVAIHCRRSMLSYVTAIYPKFRKFLLKLPISDEARGGRGSAAADPEISKKKKFTTTNFPDPTRTITKQLPV